MTRWTLNHGQLTRDGEPLLTLIRASWGDDAPPAATLEALESRIVALLNDSEGEDVTEVVSPCRVCGRDIYEEPLVHARCDEIIREASRPSVIPAGVSIREWNDGEIERARRTLGY